MAVRTDVFFGAVIWNACILHSSCSSEAFTPARMQESTQFPHIIDFVFQHINRTEI